jgi:hypothetical protein
MKPIDPMDPTRRFTPKPVAHVPYSAPTSTAIKPMPSMEPQEKPATESRTVLSALAIILVALWPPLMLLFAALMEIAGITVDPVLLGELAQDGAVTGRDFLTLGYHVMLAVLAAFVIKFRIQTTTRIQSFFAKNNGN